MREGETRVVVEGVIIGQVPATQKDNGRKKKKEASRELVAFPEASQSLSLQGERFDNDRIHALFTVVSRGNRDDKFPSNGNGR